MDDRYVIYGGGCGQKRYSVSMDKREPHFGVFSNKYNQPNTGVNNLKKPWEYRGTLVESKYGFFNL